MHSVKPQNHQQRNASIAYLRSQESLPNGCAVEDISRAKGASNSKINREADEVPIRGGEGGGGGAVIKDVVMIA